MRIMVGKTQANQQKVTLVPGYRAHKAPKILRYVGRPIDLRAVQSAIEELRGGIPPTTSDTP